MAYVRAAVSCRAVCGDRGLSLWRLAARRVPVPRAVSAMLQCRTLNPGRCTYGYSTRPTANESTARQKSKSRSRGHQSLSTREQSRRRVSHTGESEAAEQSPSSDMYVRLACNVNDNRISRVRVVFTSRESFSLTERAGQRGDAGSTVVSTGARRPMSDHAPPWASPGPHHTAAAPRAGRRTLRVLRYLRRVVCDSSTGPDVLFRSLKAEAKLPCTLYRTRPDRRLLCALHIRKFLQ